MIGYLAELLLLQPLLVIYQAIFDLPRGLGYGARIVVFSILLNLVLAPIYHEMEQRSAGHRVRRAEMERDIARMKDNFRGRERYFYIRAVHRQYGYKPIHALFSSSNLFVQILVFATVYYFLSHMHELQGAQFGRIADLGSPDGLLGGVNALPLLMTAINTISVFYYVEQRASRLQGMALSLIFLLLLYGSPSGLVLYWTMNNFWSLLRNMVAKMVQRRGGWQWAR